MFSPCLRGLWFTFHILTTQIVKTKTMEKERREQETHAAVEWVENWKKVIAKTSSCTYHLFFLIILVDTWRPFDLFAHYSRLNAFSYGVRMVWETMCNLQSLTTELYPKCNQRCSSTHEIKVNRIYNCSLKWQSSSQLKSNYDSFRVLVSGMRMMYEVWHTDDACMKYLLINFAPADWQFHGTLLA